MARRILIVLMLPVLLSLGWAAVAGAVTVDVYAQTHGTDISFAPPPLDTGVNIPDGYYLTITADPGDTWVVFNGMDTINADGSTFRPLLTQGGFTTNWGSLVGIIIKDGYNSGFFKVGTDLGPVYIPTGGELYLLCWETPGFYAGNSGFISVTITTSPVPIPASVLLLGSGLLGLGLLGWRRKRS